MNEVKDVVSQIINLLPLNKFPLSTGPGLASSLPALC